MVVINFLNKKNAADVCVYELLDQKFRLFSGLFGSSDEVLGSIESGMDFEKRIAEIYQTCKTTDEIQHEFDELQKELSGRINEKMTVARQSILENFDKDVAARLKGCQQDTLAGLDKFSQWLCNFFIMRGAEQVKPLDRWRFSYRVNGSSVTYNVQWKDAEKQGDIFLRRDDTPSAKPSIVDVPEMTFVMADGKATKGIYSGGRCDAEYTHTITLNLAEIQLTVAFPHLPENTKTFRQGTHSSVRQAVCQRHTLHCYIRYARNIYGGNAARLAVNLLQVGALASAPTCGPCIGRHMGRYLRQVNGAAATTNRNFSWAFRLR
jgi:hypothetical protein